MDGANTDPTFPGVGDGADGGAGGAATDMDGANTGPTLPGASVTPNTAPTLPGVAVGTAYTTGGAVGIWK